jgi:DNA-binding XRE family transcriptional regulator
MDCLKSGQKARNPSQGIKPRQKAAKGDSHMNIDNNYNPVRLNPADEAAEKYAIDPEFRIAYDALEDEFAALAALLDARLQAGLTQAQVASKMGVSQPVLARIESSLGKQDHSPSLNTLRRYARACGMKLIIQMVKPNAQ